MPFRKKIKGKLSRNYYVDKHIPSRSDPNKISICRSTGTSDYSEACRIEQKWIATAEDEYIQRTEGYNSPDDIVLSDALRFMMDEHWNSERPFRQISECIRLIGDVSLSELSGSRGGQKIRQLRKMLNGSRALKAKGGRGKVRGERTVNRYMAALKTLLNVNKRERGIDDLVIPSIRMYGDGKRRDRVLKNHEEKFLFETAVNYDPKFSDFLRVLLDTGARVSEALQINYRGDIDLQRRTCRFQTMKRKHGRIEYRTIPITQRVFEILKRYQYDNHDTPFAHEWANTMVSKKFHQVAIRMDDVLIKKQKHPKYAMDREFVPHMLRHTCITRLLIQGTPPPLVQAWVGHASFSTTELYTHVSADHLRIGAELLDNFQKFE